MAAIPTILRGDDSGAITLTLATGRSYTGATLVVAYQGVTRSFTNLTAGQEVSFSFTHDETAKMLPKTAPILMRLVGQYGSEETIENADARIKVTDCLGEVNAGGSFVVRPGASGRVPITELGDVATRYTLADLQAKINQIVRTLAQRSLLLVCACCLLSPRSSTAAALDWSANLGTLYNDSPVVTNLPAWAKDPNPPVSMTDNAVVLTNGALKTKAGADIPVVSSNEVNELHQIVTSWEGFLDGSNVVFSITNYISGAYRLDAAKLRILEMTNGVYHEVYNSRDEIALHLDAFRTNDLRVATNAIAAGVDAKISTFDAKIDAKAPKAWGQYSSSGEDIHSLGITNAVYMTAPTTYFAGGYDWYCVSCGEGAVCVLVANGAAANTYGEDGTFYFKDLTTTNYFGFRTRDNFIIGCDADDIRTEGQGASRRVVLEYDIDIDAGTYPILLYRPSLENFSSNAWEQLNDAAGQPVAGATYAVAWTNDQARDVCTATINVGTNAAGFFTARTVVQGEAEFSTNMKADLKGGIVTTDGEHIIKPVYSDGELTWQTFDYGSDSQVSTPSSSIVNQVAIAAFQSATNVAEQTYQPKISDYTTTNAVKQIVTSTAGTFTEWTVGGTCSYSEGSWFVYVTNTAVAWMDGEWHMRMQGRSANGNIDTWGRTYNSNIDAVSITHGGYYVTSTRTRTGSVNALGLAYNDDLTNKVDKLTGVTYDFQSGTNFTLRLYQTLTNIIDKLGGSVTNAPTFTD